MTRPARVAAELVACVATSTFAWDDDRRILRDRRVARPIFVGLDEAMQSAYHVLIRHVDRDLEFSLCPARLGVYG